MHLIYFDESKHSSEFPYFYIGGILVPDHKVSEIESTIIQIQYNFFGSSILTHNTEIHAVDLFQGKKHFKSRKITERVQLFKNITACIIDHKIPIRIIKIDVNKHRQQHKYPQPEYN